MTRFNVQMLKTESAFWLTKVKKRTHSSSPKMTRGFTLIEIMIAILVFFIIIGAISGVFIAGLKSQRRTLTTQRVIDQTSYALEYISRALRMAKKDLVGNCIGQKENYKTTRAGGGLQFINYKNECWEFFFENNQLKERRKIGAINEEILPLTSSEIKVNHLNFSSMGQSQNDNDQPRITFILSVRGIDFDVSQPDVEIQTTISQRNLDVRQ